MELHEEEEYKGGLRRRYLSPLGAWAMSFGCAVGWGAFVMPGTTFLPLAGPVGTLLGIFAGALIMFIFGRNYHYLIQHFPESGGAYGYVKRICGHDHGYICGWFLILTYIAIAWANATALALVGRNLLGGVFSFGFHYYVAGYDVYFGEVLLSIVALIATMAVSLIGKRLAAWLQTILAAVLVGGIAISFAVVLAKNGVNYSTFAPAFSDNGPSILQVVAIIALAPWAWFRRRRNRLEQRNQAFAPGCKYRQNFDATFAHGWNHRQNFEATFEHDRNHRQNFDATSDHGWNHRQNFEATFEHGRNHRQIFDGTSDQEIN